MRILLAAWALAFVAVLIVGARMIRYAPMLDDEMREEDERNRDGAWP
jgi:hypothetical protein